VDLLRDITLPLSRVDVVLDKDTVLLKRIKNVKKRVYPAKGSALFSVVTWHLENKLRCGFVKSLDVFNPKVFYLRGQTPKATLRTDTTSVQKYNAMGLTAPDRHSAHPFTRVNGY
tara:strand:+ start:725 stop:1069 length:345 start_codon:yes stop_codon:yes gene_type:complete